MMRMEDGVTSLVKMGDDDVMTDTLSGILGLCVGNPPVTGGFPACRASANHGVECVVTGVPVDCRYYDNILRPMTVKRNQ